MCYITVPSPSPLVTIPALSVTAWCVQVTPPGTLTPHCMLSCHSASFFEQKLEIGV